MEYSNVSISATNKRKDNIIFPNISKFKNLSVILEKKDTREIINRPITPIISGLKKIFIIDYGYFEGVCDIKINFNLN